MKRLDRLTATLLLVAGLGSPGSHAVGVRSPHSGEGWVTQPRQNRFGWVRRGAARTPDLFSEIRCS